MTGSTTRKDKLEELIRKSNELINQLQDIISDSQQPLEIQRNNREVKRQKGLIKDFLKEYIQIWKRLGFEIPEDLKEIITGQEEYNDFDFSSDKKADTPVTPPTISPNKQHLQNILEAKRKLLQVLEEQEAGYGKLSVPAHIVVEIKNIEDEINELEQKLQS